MVGGWWMDGVDEEWVDLVNGEWMWSGWRMN